MPLPYGYPKQAPYCHDMVLRGIFPQVFECMQRPLALLFMALCPSFRPCFIDFVIFIKQKMAKAHILSSKKWQYADFK